MLADIPLTLFHSRKNSCFVYRLYMVLPTKKAFSLRCPYWKLLWLEFLLYTTLERRCAHITYHISVPRTTNYVARTTNYVVVDWYTCNTTRLYGVEIGVTLYEAQSPLLLILVPIIRNISLVSNDIIWAGMGVAVTVFCN